MREYRIGKQTITVSGMYDRLTRIADRHNATRDNLFDLLSSDDRVWDFTSRADDLSPFEAAVWTALSATTDLSDADFEVFQLELMAAAVHETDRFGRRVQRDRHGLRYVTEDEFSFYITDCCDASAKASQGRTVCRTCYREIDPTLGGLPQPADD